MLQMGSEAQGEEGPTDAARSMCGDCLLLDVSLPSLPPFFPTLFSVSLPCNYFKIKSILMTFIYGRICILIWAEGSGTYQILTKPIPEQ